MWRIHSGDFFDMKIGASECLYAFTGIVNDNQGCFATARMEFSRNLKKANEQFVTFSQLGYRLVYDDARSRRSCGSSFGNCLHRP